jgi:hypothetical protein
VIPDLALIVSAYAIARLLCEYVFTEDYQRRIRVGLAVVACAVIAF